MKRLVRILPSLLLGLVGLVLGPLLLQSLGVSGSAAFGVGIFVSIGLPAIGAVVILSRRRARRRREAQADERPPAPPVSPRTTAGTPPNPAQNPHPARPDKRIR